MTPDSTVFSQYLSSLPPVSEPNFLENAKTFLTFASGFDLADPKIELKLRHTFHVVDACFYLARALKLSDEETYIAYLIGLLHDVGRFEQLTRFHSFDDSLIPHAKLSVHTAHPGRRQARQFPCQGHRLHGSHAGRDGSGPLPGKSQRLRL